MAEDRFNGFVIYGDKPVFEQKLARGYTHVAFGSGSWVDSKRIVGMWAFFHPEIDTVSTLQTPQFYDGTAISNMPFFERDYDRDEFKKYVREMQIEIADRSSLSKLLRINDPQQQTA